MNVGSPKFIVSGQTQAPAIYTGFIGQDLILSVLADGTPNIMSVNVWNGRTGLDLGQSESIFMNNKWSIIINPKTLDSLVVRWKDSNNDVGYQMVTVLDARVTYLIMQLRIFLDKSIKTLSNTWAFTDADLFIYLTNALLYYNSISPVTGLYLMTMPPEIDHFIIELATVYGMQAQMIYSVDTDVNYNDQGMSLNIDHFGKLNTLYSQIITRVEMLIRRYKFNYKTTKSVMSFNPERSRGWIWSQRLSAGFPFFSLGGLGTNIFRGG